MCPPPFMDFVSAEVQTPVVLLPVYHSSPQLLQYAQYFWV